MTEWDAVLFANEAFYQAFADRDAMAMASVWAENAPVTCIHPGWGALEGRQEVLQSWQAILANPGSPAVRCRGARAHMLGELAYVLCFEELDGNFLIATNVFVHEDRRWRMVHHHAGPTMEQPPDDDDGDEGGLIN